MYSPQRNKVPSDRFSPSKSPNNDYRLQKRPYEGLTLEQFLASKKTKSSPNRTPTTTKPSPKRPNNNISVYNRLAVKKSSPIRPQQTHRPTLTQRSRISTVQNKPTTTRPTFHTTATTTNRTIPTNRTRSTIIPNRRASVYIKPNQTIDKNLTTQSFTTEPKIQVCIRKRPLNKVELACKEQDIAPLSGTRSIDILAPKQKVDLTRYTEQHGFTFDEVFDCNASNVLIYQQTTRPLVDHMFQGGKATCFAYGQTGSGKTYTMLDSKHGLYMQATFDIFKLLNRPEYANLQAWVGYYEIYQGQLFDLLNNRRQLIPREDGKGNVQISGLKEYRIHSSDTMMQVFNFGNRERSTSKTNTNEASSRSHAILQILLKKSTTIHGKLNFIDLAGSERGIDRGHQSDMKIRLEGAEINRSLLALKECIRALDQDKKHAPFRGSKLTMVLKDSFVGNSKTCMIATISPNYSNSDHTLNTLRYADRVKELRGESDPRLMAQQQQQQQQEQQEDVMMPRKITQGHIKEFMHWHQVQVACNQQYLIESKALLNDLMDKKITFKMYKQNIEDLMNRKECLIQKLRDRIGLELDD